MTEAATPEYDELRTGMLGRALWSAPSAWFAPALAFAAVASLAAMLRSALTAPGEPLPQGGFASLASFGWRAAIVLGVIGLIQGARRYATNRSPVVNWGERSRALAILSLLLLVFATLAHFAITTLG